MNVIFHVIAAIGVSVLVTDTKVSLFKGAQVNVFRSGILAFITGIIFHGILDYMPHCYPVNSIIDAIISLIFIIILIFIAGRRYKPIVICAIAGSILPDIIDLSTGILNKYLKTSLPTHFKFFPWHWPEYSGSIYSGSCSASVVNHIMVVLLVVIICIARYADFKKIFLK